MLFQMLENIGLLALASLVILLVVLRTGGRFEDLRGQISVGIVFGLIALVVVKVPVSIPLGATFDTRAGPIVLSGFFAGPVGALIAATIGGYARFSVGGPAVVGGVVSFFIYGAVGALAGWLLARTNRRDAGPVGFAVLAVVSVVLVLPAFFMGQSFEVGAAILSEAWDVLLIGNMVGIVILGVMIEETRRIIDDRRYIDEARLAALSGLAAKNRFVSSVSHDIRTPLNSILGTLQLLDRDDVEAKDRARIVTAQKAGNYLLDLVNQILDYTRIEEGLNRSVKRTFSIDRIFAEVGSIFSPLAEQKGLKLDVIAAKGGDVPVSGDYDHLRQVLFNLVGNAIRYTPEGSVLVRSQLQDAGDGVVAITFWVEDTGPGISRGDQERIFEQFTRLGDDPTTEHGSGLGLSIARLLVERLGGHLELESEVGSGAKFFFTLEFERAAEPGQAVAEIKAIAEPVADLRKLRLLVVDDSDMNRVLLQDGLAHSGHHVETAESGADAIAIIRERPDAFDAVLMDIQMPGLNGDTATQEIRKSVPEAKNLLIIALTANAFDDEHEQYLRSGMNGVLTKPVNFKELEASLAALLKDSNAVCTPAKPRRLGAPDALVDWDRVAALKEQLGDERAHELIGNTLDQVEDLAADLATLVDPSQQRAAVAHKIKGQAANFGLMRLSQAAANLEAACRDDGDGLDEIGVMGELIPVTRAALSSAFVAPVRSTVA